MKRENLPRANELNKTLAELEQALARIEDFPAIPIKVEPSAICLEASLWKDIALTGEDLPPSFFAELYEATQNALILRLKATIQEQEAEMATL